MVDLCEISMDLLLFTWMFSFLFYCQCAYRTWLCTWVTRWVSYKKQELLTLREHLSSPSVFGGVRVAHLCSFLCCPIMYIYVLTSLFWCPLQFPHANVRLYLQLFVGGFMPYWGYLCLLAFRVVQHILSVFCFVFLCLVYPMLPFSLDFPFVLPLRYSLTVISVILSTKFGVPKGYLLSVTHSWSDYSPTIIHGISGRSILVSLKKVY